VMAKRGKRIRVGDGWRVGSGDAGSDINLV
jgi:hypothetical protein